MARGAYFDPNVDPELLALLEEVGNTYGPYAVELFSGLAARDQNPSSFHPKGGAIDINLIDRTTKKALANIRDPSTGQAYQAYANEVYKRASPEMKQKLRWGGYFKSGKWNKDWMHFDVGGAKNMAGGSWEGGFAPDVMGELGYKTSGGLGALDQQMQAAGYTPEQRRNAIASIESQGSGDYAAKGAWTGDPEEGRDRAYGRYQVMGSNIGPWAEQYLKKSGITPEQFMADPKLQDELFDAVYGDYVGKYGERGAASKWFTGSEKEPEVTDVNKKLTGRTYADKYMAALGGGQSPKGPLEAAGGGAGADAQSAAAAAANPVKTAPAAPKQSGWSKFGELFGKGLGDVSLGTGGFEAMKSPATPAAALAPTASASIDPNESEIRRQKLAIAMQRLNSGKLWV